ncbi:uncharacterized protein VTP21DRAFT_11336 [Calcarisporiella thermophila]|uniref:uncharacterized protein n=1 Tax=Calcarisporiella thermophila TaxID=911321 RepID=UPI0037426EC8
MAIKIYGIPTSTCVLRVIATCNALDIPYEMIYIDLRKDEHKSDKFLKLQPFGKIPVIQDGDFYIYESRAICRYLIAKYQTNTSAQLIPKDHQAAGLVEQYISVETSYYDPGVYSFVKEVLFKKILNQGEPDPAIVSASRAKMIETYTIYDKILEGKSYLVGDSLTLADIAHLPYGHYAYTTGAEDIFDSPERPNFARWWKNIINHPAWVKSISRQD